MPGSRLCSQAQQLVINFFEYFVEENRNGGPLVPVISVYGRVATALKISVRTVYTIKQRKAQNPVLSPSSKKILRKKPKTKDLPDTLKM